MGERQAMRLVVGKFSAQPARLYPKGSEAIGGVSIRLRLRTLQKDQLPASPQEETLFLSADAAEKLADQLRFAARAVRKQAESGDH